MNINYMSDLHLEFHPLKEKYPQGEVLVLAGDIVSNTETYGYQCQQIVDLASNFELCLFVFGNHEFYKGDINYTKDRIGDSLSKANNLVILDNSSYQFKNRHFHGATMWTSFSHGLYSDVASGCMNDFHLIRNNGKSFTVDEAQENCYETLEFFQNSVQKDDIVITHHAPHPSSIDRDKFGDDPLNYAFYEDNRDLIDDIKPCLWIHGHVHNNNDYIFNNTRIVSNPRGYVRYSGRLPENDSFDIMKSVEI